MVISFKQKVFIAAHPYVKKENQSSKKGTEKDL